MNRAPQPRTLEAHGRLWGAQARDWADFMEGTCRPVFQAALDRTGVGPGTRYLDVGCGTGMAADMAAARGAEVSGVDAADGMLSIARERVAKGDFRRGDLEDLPFADNTFDVVTGINAFQYAGNPVAALCEAGRVAKRDGRVVVAAFGNPDGMGAAALITALAPLLPPRPPGTPGPFALSDENALRSFASDAGLEPIEVFDVDSPWIVCRRNGGQAWPELHRQCHQGNGKHQRGGRCRSLRPGAGAVSPTRRQLSCERLVPLSAGAAALTRPGRGGQSDASLSAPTRWASAASMKGKSAPLSTSCGLVLSTPVLRSLTSW